MNVLKLRPHHINCLFFYEGKGYSNEFVENMNAIIGELKQHPKRRVKLESCKDSICSHCPNLKDDTCISNQKIDFLDQETLKQYEIKENQVFSFEEIIETIYKNYSYDKFSSICSTCEWYKQKVCAEEKIEKQQQLWGYCASAVDNIEDKSSICE